MPVTRTPIGPFVVLLFSYIAPSGNVIKEIGRAATNRSRCSFTLDGVSDFQLQVIALGGAQGSASRVTLRACPTISTDFGPISHPGEIDIIDKEFRGK